jgi:hypothetical protein
MIMPELLTLLGVKPLEPSGVARRTPQDYINALQRAGEECARKGGSQIEQIMCVLAGLVGAPPSGGGQTSVPDEVRRAAEEYAQEWQRLSAMCAGRGDVVGRLACILGGMQGKGRRGGENASPGAPQDEEFRRLRLLGIPL